MYASSPTTQTSCLYAVSHCHVLNNTRGGETGLERDAESSGRKEDKMKGNREIYSWEERGRKTRRQRERERELQGGRDRKRKRKENGTRHREFLMGAHSVHYEG